MTGTIIVWTCLTLPLILGLVFRVGAPHLFFAVMAGELLGRYFGHDVEKLAADTVGNQAPERYGEILLLLIPLFLTAFFMRKTVSNGKLVLHLIPLAITGIVLAAFLLPLLAEPYLGQVEATFMGGWILHLNRSIIGVVVGLQLIALWLFNRSEKAHSHKH